VQLSLRTGLLSYRATMQLPERHHGSCQCHERSSQRRSDSFDNLALLAPEKFAKAIAHPADRILGVRILGWIEQIGEGLQCEVVGGGHVLPIIALCGPAIQRPNETATVRHLQMMQGGEAKGLGW
jgi:hypothetical protein